MNNDKIRIDRINRDTKEIVIVSIVDGEEYQDTLPLLNLGASVEALRAQVKKLGKDLRENYRQLKQALEADPNAPVEVSPEVEGLVGQEISLDEDETGETPTTPTDGEEEES